MPIALTDAQVTSLLGIPLDTALDTVFAGGAGSATYPALLAAMPQYSNFTPPVKQQLRDTFRQIFAAWVSVTQGVTGTVNYTNAGGGVGSMNFVNGILTSFT